jgi:hypothetical protein
VIAWPSVVLPLYPVLPPPPPPRFDTQQNRRFGGGSIEAVYLNNPKIKPKNRSSFFPFEIDIFVIKVEANKTK